MIEDTGTDEDIPLPNISKKTLDRIVAYCSHIAIDGNPPPVIEKPLKSSQLGDVVTPWYT